MDAKEIATASDILDSDETVIKSWKRLYDFLEIHGNSVQLQTQFNNGMLTSHELVSSILTKWVTQNGSEATLEKLCSILVKLSYKNVSEKLRNQFSAIKLSSCISFELLKPTKHFIGRKTELQKIQTILEAGEVIVHIVGMGGVGKSELARKFAHINSGKINSIWLNGETLESLTNSIIRLAVLTQVPSTNDQNFPRDFMELFKDIIIKIQHLNAFTTLLIIDNVDATNECVQLLLSSINELYYIALVTSRHVNVLDFAGEIISLEAFSPEDAKQLLQNSIKEETVDDIKTLAKLLQYFPQALQQAIAFIKKQKIVGLLGNSYKIKNYIDEFDTQNTRMLNFPLNLIEHKYRETTMITWNLSIDQISQHESNGKFAIELLNIISYCEADNISVELMQTISSCPDNICRALELLKSYSLIKIENNQISIHRLLQEVVRLNCSSSNLEQQLLKKICHAITNSILKTVTRNDMIHILSIWNHILKLDDIIKQFTFVSNNIPVKLRDLSQNQELMSFATSSCNCFVRVLGKEHFQTLQMERYIAFATLKNGNYKVALNKYKVIISKLKRVFGEEHELVLCTSHEMATVQRHLRAFDESLQQFQTVLKIKKRVLGESHCETINTKHEIALVFLFQGKLREAMEIFNEVLDWQITNLGHKHQATLVTRNSIANCVYERKQYQSAKEKFRQLLNIMVEVQGDDHIFTLTTKFMLALTLIQLGETENALPMLNQVSALQENVLGRSHPDTLKTRSHIVLILYKKQEYAKAREILQQDLPLIKSEHPETINAKSLLASTLRKLGHNDEAVELYQEVLASRNKILEPEHKNTISTQSLDRQITTNLQLTNINLNQ